MGKRPPFRASGTHAVLKRVIEAQPRPIRESNADMPEWLDAIVAKLHAKKPEDRYQTAKEVAELLGQHLAHLQQPSSVPLPAFTPLSRRDEPSPAEPEEAVFPLRLMPRDIVDITLAILFAPLVMALFWVLPSF